MSSLGTYIYIQLIAVLDEYGELQEQNVDLDELVKNNGLEKRVI